MSRQHSNLRVADYLLKPVNKVEMGNILEKIKYKINLTKPRVVSLT